MPERRTRNTKRMPPTARDSGVPWRWSLPPQDRPCCPLTGGGGGAGGARCECQACFVPSHTSLPPPTPEETGANGSCSWLPVGPSPPSKCLQNVLGFQNLPHVSHGKQVCPEVVCNVPLEPTLPVHLGTASGCPRASWGWGHGAGSPGVLGPHRASCLHPQSSCFSQNPLRPPGL